jgi:acyl carrier protein
MRPTETDALTMRIIAVLRDVLYIPEQRFCPAMPLADLDLDSLDLVEAGLELEAMFGCPLPTAGLGAARTVGELAACLAGQPPRPALALALVA